MYGTLRLIKAVVLASGFAATAASAQPVIYVDDDAVRRGDGTTWETAYRYLQDALAAASADPNINEIRVAGGTYRPDRDTAHPDGTGNRTATFQLLVGVGLYGGYAGLGNPGDPNERDPEVYPSILSGDLAGNDGPDFSHNDENSYSVMVGSGVDETAICDGFTITAGHANGTNPYSRGGGMYISAGSPTLSSCTFTGNSADYGGGGLYNDNSSPTITGCTFSRNLVSDGFGGGIRCYMSSPTITGCWIMDNQAGSGGGIECYENSNPIITECMITDNTADYFVGGAIRCVFSSPTISRCVFRRNTAIVEGGAIYCHSSSPTVDRCVIQDNQAGDGGGIGCYLDSNPTIVNSAITGNAGTLHPFAYGGGINCYSSNPLISNCTIAHNASNEGGGIRCDQDSLATVANCILFGNAPEQLYGEGLTVSYSLVQGGYGGTGNIDGEPGFAFFDDYHLVADSLGVDAGTNSPPGGLWPTDLEGNPRPKDGDGDTEPWSGQAATADMGAYEFNPDGPSIAASPQRFEVFSPLGDSSSIAQVLHIRNAGGGTLNWGVDHDCPWLDVDPAAGLSDGETDEVIITVLASGLLLGTHNCAIEVRDPVAPNSPYAVEVVLQVTSIRRVPSAYPTIQAAIDAAGTGDLVLVARGTYTGIGNKNLDFGGKAITVRSEHGPRDTTIDCQGEGRGVYFHNGETPQSVFEGFTVTNGRETLGGGARIESCRPSIVNCRFVENEATWNYAHGGGGVYIDEASPALINCLFARNTADAGAGGVDIDGGDPVLTDCLFVDNSASGTGGVRCDYFSRPTLTNCGFFGNSPGGLLIRGQTEATLTNCVLSGNSAANWGAGMYISDWSTVTVTNCTLSGNSAGYEGGGLYLSTNGHAVIVNSILWGNSDGGGVDRSAQIHEYGGTADVTYSCINQNWSGTGNTGSDPEFTDRDGSDNTPGTEDDNLRLSPGSAVIDGGDPDFGPGSGSSDFDGHGRVLCGRVDMGAYEFGIGDYDCSQYVDLDDFTAWLACTAGPGADTYEVGCEAFDFDLDEDIDLEDFAGFQLAFGSE